MEEVKKTPVALIALAWLFVGLPWAWGGGPLRNRTEPPGESCFSLRRLPLRLRLPTASNGQGELIIAIRGQRCPLSFTAKSATISISIYLGALCLYPRKPV